MGNKSRTPCKHCSELAQPNWRGISHEIVISDGALFYYDSMLGWEGVNINFCPFCGRSITDTCVNSENKQEGLA